jgi:glutamyl-tRNA synthetase
MVRTRIAPSPTGQDIHIGNLYTALINWAWAKKNNGKFIIRIEDTDRTRLVPGSEQRIINSLKAYGLEADESIISGGDFGPYRQSDRLDIYKQYVQKLIDNGSAYYCTCTKERLDQVRKDQQAAKQIPRYDRHCLHNQQEVKKEIAAGKPYVVRLLIPEGDIVFNDLLRGEIVINGKDMDDQVLLKSDGFPTYHLAVVIDDHLMQISHIIRAEEWLPSTPKHVLLYQAFGWELPIFCHLPILRNPDKSKLSKRKNPVWASWYLEQGYLPEAVLNYLSLMGWTHPEQKEIFNLNEFIEKFDLKDINTTGPIFDIEKLKWMNGKYIREQLPDEELLTRLKKYLTVQIDDEVLSKVLPLIKERMEVLSDANHLLEFLNPDLEINIEEVRKQSKGKKSDEEIKALLNDLRSRLDSDQEFTVASIEQDIRDLKAKYPDWGGRDYFMTIRVVTTAFPVTPPLFESIEVLGKDLVLKRINSALKQIK